MAVYYGMVSFIDAEVGRLLDLLDARDELDTTLIVFTTDHGHFLGQHGLVAKGPFHYEDLIRILFIAAWPGRIPAGETSDAIQSLIDLMPTFLEAAGADIPGTVQEVSQLSTWAGGAPVRSHTLCENRHNPVMPHLKTYVEAGAKITVYRQGDHGER